MTALPTINIVLPRLVGVRQRATNIGETLPDDLSNHTVVVDATETVTMAQGFCDELVNQIIKIRKAKMLKIINAPTSGVKYLQMSTQVRKLQPVIFENVK